MKGLVYRPPCDGQGRFQPWLNDLRNQSGAYVVRTRESGVVLYVGMSQGQLAKTIKRHFWDWKDSPDRPHRVYQRERVEVAVRLCPPAAAPGAERNLVRRLNPRDNGNGWGEKPY